MFKFHGQFLIKKIPTKSILYYVYIRHDQNYNIVSMEVSGSSKRLFFCSELVNAYNPNYNFILYLVWIVGFNKKNIFEIYMRGNSV